MLLLLRYLRAQWRVAVAALLLAMTNQVFVMADPLIFRQILDKYVTQHERHTQAGFFLGVGLWFLAMLGAVLVAWVAKGFQTEMVSRVSQRVSARMFADGIRHSLELPYAEFEQRRSGETLDRIRKLRWDVERFLVTAVNTLFTSVIGVLVVIAYAARVNWVIVPCLVLIAPALAVLSVLLSRRLKEVQAQVLHENADLAGSATETLRNMELVKSLGLTRQEVSRFRMRTDRILSLELEKIRRARRFTFVHGACVHLMRVLLFLLLLYLLFSRQATVGQFLALFMYSYYIFTPMQEMGTVVNHYRDAEASLDSFRKLLEHPKEASGRVKHTGRIEALEFDNVSFQYAGAHRPALAGVSLRISRGETVAFVGPSGAGKTTLVKLISALYVPASGRVLYNGIPTTELHLDGLRERIGLVTQETQLFSGSIRQNLLFVRPESTDEECLEALRQAAGESILRRAGRGLDTTMGEGGMRLSGGERQRMAIARALLRRPDLLVFDEATSALDSLTEKEISDTIRYTALGRSVMTILIAHRLSTVLYADRIYVLEAGRIVQAGQHAELAGSEGLYRRLWLQQSGENHTPDRCGAIAD